MPIRAKIKRGGAGNLLCLARSCGANPKVHRIGIDGPAPAGLHVNDIVEWDAFRHPAAYGNRDGREF
jgi:hypothetical protein